MKEEELDPAEILKLTKKSKHTVSVAVEPFSSAGRDFQVYNVSMKKDYTEEFQYLNFRRGLAYIEEIIEFKNSNLTVARKGLRKFKDLLPEYVEIKESHINTSKYHSGEKERILANLNRSNAESYIIYNTEKLNGENAQISFVYGRFWVIGSKNKTFLLENQMEIETFKNKHQHKLTIMIARQWFSMIALLDKNKLDALKSELNQKTLVGEYCNSENLQHLVDYGKEPKLFFYSLVEKDNRVDDCLPVSKTIKFCQEFGLPSAHYEIVKAQDVEQTLFLLKDIVRAIYESSIKQKGEGSVIYVSGVKGDSQTNLLVCKVKTIEYRIYRKLREKLKVYLEKFNKGFKKLHKDFTDEISEISREFNIIKPLENYVELARRAFELCEDQNKPLSRLISNKYITFLSIVERKDITKQKFLQMLKQGKFQLPDQQNIEQEQDKEKEIKEDTGENKEQGKDKDAAERKHVLVLITLTIPSTGKSTLFQAMRKMNKTIDIEMISSDQIRRAIMEEKMKKTKNMTKQVAFQKSAKQTNQQFYRSIGEVFDKFSQSDCKDCLLILDKNQPESAHKEAIKQINQRAQKYKNLEIKSIAVFPNLGKRIFEKGKYSYPFSSLYVLTCLKRVISRQQHLTLEGTPAHRCSIVLAFANLFRNYSLSSFNLEKYFKGKVELPFYNENIVNAQHTNALQKQVIQILLGGKPGNFDYVHPNIQNFIQELKQWKMEEKSREDAALQALKKIQDMFDNFDQIKCQSKATVEE